MYPKCSLPHTTSVLYIMVNLVCLNKTPIKSYCLCTNITKQTCCVLYVPWGQIGFQTSIWGLKIWLEYDLLRMMCCFPLSIYCEMERRRVKRFIGTGLFTAINQKPYFFVRNYCDQKHSPSQFWGPSVKAMLQRQTTKHADWDNNMGKSGGSIKGPVRGIF